LRLKPEEWVAIQIGVVAGVGALLALPLGFIGALVGAVVGWLGCRIFLTQKTKKRRAAFDTQLPDSLQLLAGGLRAGFALNQAVGSIVREGTEPTASEFGRALSEVRLGADLEDALANLAERMQSADMELVLMAIHTAREVGGNLAEILDTTVNTMRERVQLRGHVRVLSAEGRLSARVLTGLPILMVGYLRLTKPDFLRPLYTTAPGIVLSIIGVVLLGLGSLWLSRLTKIEV
jgi:tight adherence protein B